MSFAGVRRIRIDSIRTPPILLRTMDDEELAALVRSISDVGYVEPVQVVEDCGGGYRLVNGYHRLKVLSEVFGLSEVDAVVLGRMCCGNEKPPECWDEYRYGIEVVRLNNIRGRWIAAAVSEHLKGLLREAERRGIPTEKFLSDLGSPRRAARLLGGRGRTGGTASDVWRSIEAACRESARVSASGDTGNVLVFAYLDRVVVVVRLGSREEAMRVADLVRELEARGTPIPDALEAVVRGQRGNTH
ncbi:MAG: ParB/RepB/Spo0J family partition protein [Thermofilaceae archaeon]